MEITSKWVNTQELTPALERYFPLFRLIVCMGVDILRDPFNLDTGIHIVGTPKLVEAVYKNLIQILSDIETAANKKVHNRVGTHLNHIKASYKDSLVKICCKMLEGDIKKFRTTINLTPEIVFHLKKEKELRSEYINQIPSLKILKNFRCSKTDYNI